MAEYEHSSTVGASPDAVFAFVSDVGNLPRYLPTTKRAESQPGERVRVEGEAGGHRYENDGFFRVDEGAKRLEWGSDGENNYAGWMTVEPQGGGQESRVTVHLSFEPKPKEGQRLDAQTGDRDRTIREGLEAGLASIRNIVEGQGGKVEPSAAT